MKKTCLIYGHNGLDLDVTINLVSYYSDLGFNVFFSERLYDADLLVVLRAVDKEINLDSFNFFLIHVFDYGGWGFDKFIKSINHEISYIFTTSEDKRSGIIEKCNFPDQNIFVAFPPVIIDLWKLSPKKIKFECVHIGNFKPITENDEVKVRFDKAILTNKIHVWGLGWNDLLSKEFYHGKIGLFNVSSIYSKSKVALGLMYPFQRNVTFSGRFWHAPLNGCHLLSEKGLYTNDIPGLIETDYTPKDLAEKLNKISYDRLSLIEAASKYWTEQKQYTKALMLPSIIGMGSCNSFEKYIIFIKMMTINFLRRSYQKFIS